MISRPRLLAPLFASVISCACGSASRIGLAFEPLSAPRARFDTESAQIFIKDERKGISQNRTFDTPLFSLPGNGESRPLATTPELRAEMAALLKRWVPQVGSDRLYFEVY